ncbi:hypothetical protein D3C76_1323550 [compost metagenome]
MDITHPGTLQAQRIANTYTCTFELPDAGGFNGLGAFNPRQGKFDRHIQRDEENQHRQHQPGATGNHRAAQPVLQREIFDLIMQG